MGLFRKIALGAAIYGIYRSFTRSAAIPTKAGSHDGLAALFSTREQADLAVEHLVQQHGVERSTIFIEPVSDANSAGAEISGGDAASGDKSSDVRHDAALKGALRLTVAASGSELDTFRAVLEDAGATRIEAF